MLKRIRVKGFKSLAEVEVRLESLVVLFGPNAAGKSNFLDILQLLSRIACSRNLKEAFEPPYRGKPLESFLIGAEGLKGLVQKERLSFSVEADLELSDAIVQDVNQKILEMRHPGIQSPTGQLRKSSQVRERNLRYYIEVEMLPRTGIVRVADESLVALNPDGQPNKKRNPFFESNGTKIHLRREGQAHPTYHDRLLDHSILSMPHYPPHYPHVVAARSELESWLFFYFEPRQHMRTASPVKEVRHIGLMGEELAAFLNTLKAINLSQFRTIEKALHILIPYIDGIEVAVNDLGEVELHLREHGVAIPARVLSEGTLRLLGLLALIGVNESPAMVGFEEPENGVHPRRIELIAELLRTRESLGLSQYIVTTHSPLLVDYLQDHNLYVVRRDRDQTHIEPFTTWGPLKRRDDIDTALSESLSDRPVSARILRGDFDA